ncbi:MAG: DNA/RNA non-specific endonuclease [Alistipes sp.]|nr:DNA/RNA non-specific endonuclease [Alistipes sp.]
MIQQRTSRSRNRRSAKSRRKNSSPRSLLYLGLLLLALGFKYLYNEYLSQQSASVESVTTAVPESVSASPSVEAADAVEQPTEQAAEQSVAPSRYKVVNSGWAELPAEVDDKALYTTWHICDDGRRNYTVCYSSEQRCPLWVASPMHPSYKGEAKRSDSFIFDPTLPMNLQPLLRRSYGEYTRGHLLGSAERTSSEESNRQTFYATNIAPQLQLGFNASNGAWNNWERFADKQSCADTLYVVTGCIFGDYTDATGQKVEASKTINKNDGEEVGVPTAFYKVLLRTKDGSTGRSVMECKASELKCAAFVVGHYTAKGRKPTAADVMSVAELERLTGLTFFANVPNAPKRKAEPKDWGL